MKNYAKEVERAGIGRTPQLCQDALKEMLEELFEGRKFMGQEGRKPLKIIRQDIDIPEDNDEDVDTDISAARWTANTSALRGLTTITYWVSYPPPRQSWATCTTTSGREWRFGTCSGAR